MKLTFSDVTTFSFVDMMKDNSRHAYIQFIIIKQFVMGLFTKNAEKIFPLRNDYIAFRRSIALQIKLDIVRHFICCNSFHNVL